MSRDKDRTLRGEDRAREKLNQKDYDRELSKLHVELVKLQEWVKHKGLKICIAFEGRDGAGKGGTIKAITERVSPRVFRVVALAAPEKGDHVLGHASQVVPYGPTNRVAGRPGGLHTQRRHPVDMGRDTIAFDHHMQTVVGHVLA